MFLFTDMDTVKEAIGFIKIISAESIMPAQCPKIDHSPYRNGYGWLFWYERKLARFLEPWLKEFRQEIIGEKGVICEALSNAYCHGHRKDPAKVIKVNVFMGEHGLIIQIIDNGKGFNVHQIIDDCKRGKAYYHLAGNGLRTMRDSQNFAIFFNRNGTGCHIVRLFDGNYVALRRIHP